MIRIILIILLVSGPPFVCAEDTEKQEPKTSGSQAAEDQDRQQDQIIWPQQFTPSQDVGADSQVSFPTDI